MLQLQELIKPTWRVERSLDKAWAILHEHEKEHIQKRIDDLFYNEIPFQLKHDKIAYLHLFSMFAQLELIGLRGLILTLDKLEGTLHYQQMRKQITDEVFHAIIFIKVSYQLSIPYTAPPPYNKGIEHFMSSLESEPDLATSLTLIGLIAEGWIEELFLVMKENGIAESILEVIIADENRHIDEYDLYKAIGLPSKSYLSKKIAIFEQELINTIFSQEQYIVTLITLLGRDKTLKLLANMNKKQHQMLNKFALSPSEHWQFFMNTISPVVQRLAHDPHEDTAIEPTSMRKILSSVWSDPELPTQSSVFSINVSPVCFFEKKFKSETLTCLMLQTLSKTMSNVPQLRIYMSNHKLHHPKDCYVGLAVQLPGCGDAIGSIEFKNCHAMSLSELSQHIKHDIAIMTYCHKKVEALKIEHPYLLDVFNRLTMPLNERVYRDPLFAKPSISLSNIGHFGYEVAISPLFPNETVKLTLATIERKQVFNKTTNEFEVQDVLPVGMSVDHRVFDANIPVPHYMQAAFVHMFTAMQAEETQSNHPESHFNAFVQTSNELLERNLDLGFMYLYGSSVVWRNYQSHQNIVSSLSASPENLASL